MYSETRNLKGKHDTMQLNIPKRVQTRVFAFPTTARLRCFFLIQQHYLLLSCAMLALLGTSNRMLAASNSASLPLHTRVVITLKNGDVLSGEVASESEQVIVLSTELMGTVSVPRVATSVITPSAPPQQSADQTSQMLQQHTEGTSSPQEPSAKVPGARANPDQLYLSKLKISASLLESTQQQQTYNGELQLVKNWHSAKRNWSHQRSLLVLSPTYDDKNSTKGATVTHNYNGVFQHIVFSPKSSLYFPVLVNLYSNNSLGIYLQQAYGGGIGKTWDFGVDPNTHEPKKGSLELTGDLRFIGEHFYRPAKPAAPIPSLGLLASGLSERYGFPLTAFNAGAKISETIEFVPVFSQADAWQAHGIVEISVPFTKQLSFVASAFDNYMQNTPPTFRKNYFKTTIGLQYSPTAK